MEPSRVSKPQVLSSNTQLPKGGDSNAAPAPLHPPTIPVAPAAKEKEKKKKKKEKDDPEVPAVLRKERAKVAKARETLHQQLPQDVAPHAGGEAVVATLLRGQSRLDAPAR